MYEACEALFCSLADEAQKYTDWLALGDGVEDLDALVEQQLWGTGAAASAVDTGSGCGGSSEGQGGSSGSDGGGGLAAWELNMKMLKTAARDLDKLPNEVRGGCVLINIIRGYVQPVLAAQSRGCPWQLRPGKLLFLPPEPNVCMPDPA